MPTLKFKTIKKMYQVSFSTTPDVLFSDIDAKVSSLSAPFTRYLSWKAKEDIGVQTDLQVMTNHMFDKSVLFNLIRLLYCL